MDDHDQRAEDFLEALTRLTVIERECLQHLDAEEDLLERLQYQREVALERLWSSFQGAASSLAQLYKERPLCDCCDRCHYRSRSHDHSKDWQPFQGAANRVTKLFRDGSEGLRAGIELGYHAGYQRRNRDIINWVKKRRKNIRREDILLNLSGRSPPRRKLNEHRINSLSVSPKPAASAMESDYNRDEHPREFDFTAFMEGRNPFTEGRKRHSDINIPETPHKRGRFL